MGKSFVAKLPMYNLEVKKIKICSFQMVNIQMKDSCVNFTANEIHEDVHSILKGKCGIS